ncbi:hypothetical protein L208DRAFT_1382747 [Tricholoma matsutake]|nr:hypothetical protein L208DRAFT_1382747 [Tricholoma matsutake 945]
MFVQHPVQIPNPLSLEVENRGQNKHSLLDSQNSLLLKFTKLSGNFWKLKIRSGKPLLRLPGINQFSYIHHAAIVTGQPGIGKTVFLIYVLLCRLLNGLTTIYCDESTHTHIFDDMGIRRLILSSRYHIPELDVNPLCCALVNLRDQLTFVPNMFYPKIHKSRVIVATSLDKNHWSTFAHEHLVRICCMPTWEWGPLYIASLLFTNKDNFNTLDVDHCKWLQEAYSIFHGILQLCFRSFTTTGLDAQWVVIHQALNGIQSMDDFIRATMGQLPFNPNMSHHLVRVEPIDTRWLKRHTELLSNHIAKLVFECIHMVTKARLSETLVQYLADPDAHTKAGILFKHAAHCSIGKGLVLRMTCLSSGKNLEVSIPVTAVGKNEKSRYYSLAIRKKSGSQDVHADFLDLYMTLISKTEGSIDALFISSAYITFLFQMMVSSHHPINF